jgi:hypothetical protein
MSPPRYNFKVEAKERIGNIYVDRSGTYVACNEGQLVFLLNRANITIGRLECIGETTEAISLP